MIKIKKILWKWKDQWWQTRTCYRFEKVNFKLKDIKKKEKINQYLQIIAMSTKEYQRLNDGNKQLKQFQQKIQ